MCCMPCAANLAWNLAWKLLCCSTSQACHHAFALLGAHQCHNTCRPLHAACLCLTLQAGKERRSKNGQSVVCQRNFLGSVVRCNLCCFRGPMIPQMMKVHASVILPLLLATQMMPASQTLASQKPTGQNSVTTQMSLFPANHYWKKAML